jgi:hypothetical protein
VDGSPSIDGDAIRFPPHGGVPRPDRYRLTVHTWDDVRRIALSLPETSEKLMWGTPSWRVRDKLFVWERPLRNVDFEALGDDAPQGEILGARVDDLFAKEALIADEPAIFTTPHFDGYPAVLIEFDKIAPDVLEEIIVEAWISRAPKRLAREYIETHGLSEDDE